MDLQFVSALALGNGGTVKGGMFTEPQWRGLRIWRKTCGGLGKPIKAGEELRSTASEWMNDLQIDMGPSKERKDVR